MSTESTTRGGTTRWWALALIATAQFMVIMDTSIIGVALPQMQADLGFTQHNLSWVFNAYVIALGGLLLLGGRLSDLFGARRIPHRHQPRGRPGRPVHANVADLPVPQRQAWLPSADPRHHRGAELTAQTNPPQSPPENPG